MKYTTHRSNLVAATLSLGLALVACADPDPTDDVETEEAAAFSILTTDDETGTRGELRLGDTGVAFETSRILDESGEAQLGVVLTDLAGVTIGPGESDANIVVALEELERSALAFDATGALAEDLGVVAVASGYLARSAPPPGVSRKTTTTRSCTPDGGAHRAYSQFVYTMQSASVYKTSGYWMFYERTSGFSLGSRCDEKLVGSEWSWRSPDSAPVGKWFFRSLSKRGVGGVKITSWFDKALATDPSCTVEHRLR